MPFSVINSIDPFYFIIGLSLGLFFVYISNDNIPEIILMYPTPENAGKIVYKDTANVCYKYNKEEVKCPANKTKIKQMPIQHVEPEDGGIIGKLKKIF